MHIRRLLHGVGEAQCMMVLPERGEKRDRVRPPPLGMSFDRKQSVGYHHSRVSRQVGNLQRTAS